MRIGDVWSLTCMPTYYVRIEGDTGKTLQIVECNAKGARRRLGRVRNVRKTTFLNAYVCHSQFTSQEKP